MATLLEENQAPQLSLKKMIANAVTSGHPETVGQLAKIITADAAIDESDFITALKEMVSEGALDLRPPSYEVESVLDYLFNPTLSGWLWVSVGTVALAMFAVTSVPDLFPVNVVRWVLGSILVLYLPGFSLLELLFPTGKQIDSLERFALSIGVSLAVIPLIGLVLNFTQWGIRFASVTVALGTFTIGVLAAAAARKYLAL